MYHPRPWHLSIEISIVTFGLYVAHQLGYGWDVVIFFQFPLAFIACCNVWYRAHAGVIWQKFQAGEPVQEKPKTYVPLNVGGKVTAMEYQQVEKAVHLDKTQQFVNILLRQIAMGKVDLRETYWIHPGRFDNRAQFIAARDALERVGAIERRDKNRKNSEFVVADPRILKTILHGVKIEEMPPSPTE